MDTNALPMLNHGIMPQFSFCNVFQSGETHCTARHCIKDCLFESLTVGYAKLPLCHVSYSSFGAKVLVVLAHTL